MEILRQWCESCLPDFVQTPQPLDLAPVSGDAGFRSYYRTNTIPTLIAVDAPPEHEDNPGFVSRGIFLRRHGIGVPGIYAVDFHLGHMLQADLGDQLYLDKLNSDTASALYDAADKELLAIQCLPVDREVFPDYSEELLLQEMRLFPEWFVGQLLGLSLSREDKALLEDTFAQLVENALQQPQVVVHRDYHSRNLLCRPGGGVGVVDFQDAVIGSLTYDLVSLYRDCYICWPQSFVQNRVLGYAAAARREGILPDGIDDKTFAGWFDLMGLQRHIKVLGIFSRLWLRDGKPGYLNDLPLVIRYTLEQARSSEAMAPFADWFEERLLPALPQHDWYRPAELVEQQKVISCEL